MKNYAKRISAFEATDILKSMEPSSLVKGGPLLPLFRVLLLLAVGSGIEPIATFRNKILNLTAQFENNDSLNPGQQFMNISSAMNSGRLMRPDRTETLITNLSPSLACAMFDDASFV